MRLFGYKVALLGSVELTKLIEKTTDEIYKQLFPEFDWSDEMIKEMHGRQDFRETSDYFSRDDIPQMKVITLFSDKFD